MTDYEIIEALSDSEPRKRAAEDFLKQADIGAYARAAGKILKDNAVPLAVAAGGGLATGMASYLMSRSKDGKPSHEQKVTRELLRATEAVARDAKKEGRELTFREESQKALAPAMARMADVKAKFPGKSSLLVVPAGMAASLSLLKALK